MIQTSTDNQPAQPRYIARGFAVAQRLNNGRVDIVLPDGRVFRAEGKNPGPVGGWWAILLARRISGPISSAIRGSAILLTTGAVIA